MDDHGFLIFAELPPVFLRDCRNNTRETILEQEYQCIFRVRSEDVAKQMCEMLGRRFPRANFTYQSAGTYDASDQALLCVEVNYFAKALDDPTDSRLQAAVSWAKRQHPDNPDAEVQRMRRVECCIAYHAEARDMEHVLDPCATERGGAAPAGETATETPSGQPRPERGDAAVSSEETSARASQYVFCRRGEVWDITFEGVSKHMKDSKGLRYLAHLLSDPKKKVGINDLFLAANPLPSVDAQMAARRKSVEEEALDDPHNARMTRLDLGNSEDVIDDETRRAVEQKIEELERDLALYEETNTAKAAETKEEIEKYRGYLRNASGPGSRIKKAPSVIEQRRKAITNCIRDALKKFDKEHERLARHLRNSVKTGMICSYTPDRPIPWVL